MAKKIEVFSAGCSTCKETIEVVKRLAGSSHEVVVHDMQKPEVASIAFFRLEVTWQAHERGQSLEPPLRFPAETPRQLHTAE